MITGQHLFTNGKKLYKATTTAQVQYLLDNGLKYIVSINMSSYSWIDADGMLEPKSLYKAPAKGDSVIDVGELIAERVRKDGLDTYFDYDKNLRTRVLPHIILGFSAAQIIRALIEDHKNTVAHALRDYLRRGHKWDNFEKALNDMPHKSFMKFYDKVKKDYRVMQGMADLIPRKYLAVLMTDDPAGIIEKQIAK